MESIKPKSSQPKPISLKELLGKDFIEKWPGPEYTARLEKILNSSIVREMDELSKSGVTPRQLDLYKLTIPEWAETVTEAENLAKEITRLVRN
jgi:hypothetical protein